MNAMNLTPREKVKAFIIVSATTASGGNPATITVYAFGLKAYSTKIHTRKGFYRCKVKKQRLFFIVRNCIRLVGPSFGL
jgi:hypothetical protein